MIRVGVLTAHAEAMGNEFRTGSKTAQAILDTFVHEDPHLNFASVGRWGCGCSFSL